MGCEKHAFQIFQPQTETKIKSGNDRFKYPKKRNDQRRDRSSDRICFCNDFRFKRTRSFEFCIRIDHNDCKHINEFIPIIITARK